MNEARPLNRLLIVFTLVITCFATVSSKLTAPRHYSDQTAFIAGLVLLALSPILIAWTRALWNTLVPRITGWREISFWEAAGLSALVFFLGG